MKDKLGKAAGLPRRVGRSAVAGILLVSQVAACAKSPDSIEAKYVSPIQYKNWDCDQLLDERMRLVREVDRVSGLQRENANADVALMTVGLIILWPALLGLAATRDRKDELARLKGEYEAVDSQMKMKQCALPPPQPSPAPAPPANLEKSGPTAGAPPTQVPGTAPVTPVATTRPAAAGLTECKAADGSIVMVADSACPPGYLSAK